MLAVLPEDQPVFGLLPSLSVTVLNCNEVQDSQHPDGFEGGNPAHDSDDVDSESDADGNGNDDDGEHGGDVYDDGNDDEMEYEDDDVDDECSDIEGDGDSNGEGDSPVDPAFSHSIDDVPELHRRIIEEALLIDWDIDKPRDFQVVSINQGAFNDDTVMYLISKTGSGKSAVPLTIATLRRGVTIVLVPLLGLGSDQVKKAAREEKGIAAYHVDEHRGADGKLLREMLLNMSMEESQSTTKILFMSPQSLTYHLNETTGQMVPSPWLTTIRKLAAKDQISLMCIDEAHSIEQQGRYFRPDFQEAVKNLQLIHNNLKTKCPRLVMSATLRKIDQTTISKLFGGAPDFILWTEMARRRITIDVLVSGNPTLAIRKRIKKDLKKDPTMKIIWYTNSKTKAEESLVPSAEGVLEELGIVGDVIPLTGGNGIMDKVFVMDAFGRVAAEVNNNTHHPNATVDPMYYAVLPNLVVMPATSAANCGVSSAKCYRSYRVGPPPSMYDLVQEMGRVDRVGDLPPGANRYEIHLSVPLFVSMYVRVMSVPDKRERNKQLIGIYEVLSSIMVPTICQHSSMESYFENDAEDTDKQPCKSFCSYCSGRVGKHAGKFKKEALTNLFLGQLFNGKSPSFEFVLNFIKENKKTIYVQGSVPKKLAGQFHGLFLQLLANGILELSVDEKESKNIGSDKLLAKNIIVKLGQMTTEDGTMGLAILQSRAWAGISFN
mmetsp:Transcript_11434/g.25104  ORF Transcript_11434/g.25104 Transcript_11434/m.25104 type:complete len:717 (-) Transcript_11434:43-2193(-)